MSQSCAGDCRKHKPQEGFYHLLQIFFPIPRQFYSGFQEDRSLRRSPQEYLLQKWWRKLVPSQSSRWAGGNTKKRYQSYFYVKNVKCWDLKLNCVHQSLDNLSHGDAGTFHIWSEQSWHENVGCRAHTCTTVNHSRPETSMKTLLLVGSKDITSSLKAQGHKET